MNPPPIPGVAAAGRPASRPASRAAPITEPSALARRALEIGRRTALGVLGDRDVAADVAQDVAITALTKARSLREPQALDAWLHRVAVRAALKEARRGQARRDAELEHQARRPGGGSPDELHALLARLGGLPARQRAALTLRYVHDLSDDAIARALGCRPGTVRALLSRGRAALRAASPDHEESR